MEKKNNIELLKLKNEFLGSKELYKVVALCFLLALYFAGRARTTYFFGRQLGILFPGDRLRIGRHQ